jgi:tetratricopeptide (TPR) repeat protein
VEAAQGNPLVAIEAALGKMPSGRLPRSTSPSFDQALIARLSTLSTHAQEVAAALALVGRPLTFPSIAEVTSLATATLIAALEELEAASFVTKKGATYAFVHEKYQAAIDHHTAPTTRAGLHSRIATLKERAGGGHETTGIEVARHYALAGRNRRAVKHALAAAHYAKSLGAVRERATALELASALADRHADQLLELADCYLDLKEFGLVASLCGEILAKPKATSVNRLEASFLQTSAAHQSGDILLVDARAALEKLLESGEDFPHRMQAYFQLVRATDKSGDPVRARQHAKALRRASATTAALNGKGYGTLAKSYVISRYGDPRRALESLRSALQEAQRINDWELETIVRSGLGAVLKQVGRFADSVQSIQGGLEFARKTLNPLGEATALNDLAVTEIALGRHADAAEHLAEAARIDAAYPRWPLRAYRMSNEGVLHYHVGNIDAARTALGIAFDFAEKHDVWAIQMGTRGMLGMCAVRQHLDADLAVHAHWLQAELPARRQMVPDLGPADATLAWFQAKDGDPKGASFWLEQRCRYLRRRDMDHWMFATLELIRLREHFEGHRLTAERQALQVAAVGFGATAMARLAADVTS